MERKFTLRQSGDEIVMYDELNNQVPTTDILNIFPDSSVYAFNGQMGAGKTTFIKQLCKDLGVTDVVNSPTFAIVNVYEYQGSGVIYHFDCYRLRNAAEAIDFGAEDYFYSGNYCFIEWPEVIDDILPEDIVNIEISVLPDKTRSLRVSR